MLESSRVATLSHAEAMVNGKKQIENRSWKIPVGWCVFQLSMLEKRHASFLHQKVEIRL